MAASLAPTGIPAFASATTYGPERIALLGRRMFERELGVSRLLYLDDERHSSFRAAKWERLTGVLVRDSVHVLKIAVRTVLDHAPTKLRLSIRIVEINNGERDSRIAPCIFGFE